jgi:hypothetical protein
VLQFLNTTLNPALYHGDGKKAPFFEGWYYKLVSADESHRFAIIPGMIKGEKAHAFIQILDGATGRSTYHKYAADQFRAVADQFQIRIGKNVFHQDGLSLKLDASDRQLFGELSFIDTKPWPVTWLSPGIMGPYAWAPAMECYHGVLSFDHAIQGVLTIDGQVVDFSGGRGYIEKDWGRSFPSAWVWYQSNHFPQAGVCLTASIAVIPWLRSAFRGFIIGLWISGILHCFASYTGAKTDHLEIGNDRVEWAVSDRKYRLEMRTVQAAGGCLMGPTRDEMGKRVDETLDAKIEVRLSSLTGGVLFEGQGRNAGLEVNGDIRRLVDMRD